MSIFILQFSALFKLNCFSTKKEMFLLTKKNILHIIQVIRRGYEKFYQRNGRTCALD